MIRLVIIFLLVFTVQAYSDNYASFSELPQNGTSNFDLKIPEKFLGDWQNAKCWPVYISQKENEVTLLEGALNCKYARPDQSKKTNWIKSSQLHIFAIKENKIFALSESIYNSEYMKMPRNGPIYDYLEIEYEAKDRILNDHRITIRSYSCSIQDNKKFVDLKILFENCIPKSDMNATTITYFPVGSSKDLVKSR